jgi:ABC-2 type transport system ATP-binding protein
MRRQEIANRYNEIVEFSGIERFIETPVKRYSSGMFVRLAFSVAVHLRNDILLLDEVLAVGDAEFQRKCLEKVDATVKDGRTVVFVSHGIANVMRICDRCAWIDEGGLAAFGPTGEVASQYFKNVTASPQAGEAIIGDEVPRSVAIPGARVRRVALLDEGGRLLKRVHLGQPFSVQLTMDVSEPIPDGVLEVGLNTIDGARVVTAQNIDEGRPSVSLRPGMHEIQADFDLTLLPGDFTIDVGLAKRSNGYSYEYLQRVLTFTALREAEGGAERYPWHTVRGSVRPRTEWSVRSLADRPAAASSVTG